MFWAWIDANYPNFSKKWSGIFIAYFLLVICAVVALWLKPSYGLPIIVTAILAFIILWRVFSWQIEDKLQEFLTKNKLK